MSVPTILTGKNEPVAIVGMGCRFSGGVKDPPGLWELLKNKRDGWQEFKSPRFPSDGFYHPHQDRPGSIRTKGAFLCDEDAREFDHAFFGITGREVETMDPSQRKLLEVVYEALENAGETWDSISGSRTGVYIGMFALDHVLMQSREWDYTKPYAATGAETSILANRISYVFNLHGPSLATNTACSSSMYALHLAVSAIRSGDCDGAIVAAANWIQDPSMQIVLDKLGALSPTSRCHTFDAAADGYARGEGFAAIYLKKSDLALLEDTPIRAMIRGTGVNANGKTGGITRPSAKGQEDAIRKAFENAGNLPLEDTTFFECHGTGTPAGDPLEVAAVGHVFASSRKSDAPEDRLLIGSIKPNLGHTEGASALASIMKVVLSLEAGEIAPTCGIEQLNPNIDFDAARVHVVKDAAVPWPEGKVRRASVNSFGFGGANGNCIIDHVNEVLPDYVKPGIVSPARHANGSLANGHTNGASANGESANGNGHVNGNGNGHVHVNGNGSTHGPKHTPIKPETVKKTASSTASTRDFVLLPFSAHNASSLAQNIDTLAKAVAEKKKWTLADIAYTLGCKRSRFQQRTFRIVDTAQQDAVTAALADEKRVFTSPIQTSNVGFVFTGQGAQWHAMGGKLFEYGVFRSTISHLDYVLDQLRQDSGDSSSWTIAATLKGDCEPEHIQAPHVSQVACTAIQIGLVDVLASWSVRPRAVAGHSSGEMGAAYAGGYLTAAAAIAAAYFRGQAVAKNKLKGAMLAVGLGADDVACYLERKEDHVRVAAMNSPGSVTLSGDADAVDAVSRELSNRGIFNRLLKTSGSAYHSHHMVAVGGAYIDSLIRGQEVLKKLGLSEDAKRYPRLPWASSVKPDKAFSHGDDLGGPHYWRENLESPVRFTQAVTKLMTLDDQPIDVLIEIGPHGALKGPIEQTLKGIGKPANYATALTRNEDGRNSLLQLAGTLFATNAEIDLTAVNSVDASDANGKPSFVHGSIAVDLPTYQYTYGPVSYYESRISKEFRLRDHIRHDLLGSDVLGASKLQPQWRNVLRIKDIPWLADHRLVPDAVFPAAGYIALGVEAATRVYQALPGAREITGYSFQNVDIEATLIIPEDDYGVEIIVGAELVDKATADEPAWLKFTVTSVSRASSEWTQHCTGLVKVEVALAGPRAQLSAEMDPRYPSVVAWYDKFTSVGLGYGKTFQPLSELRVDPHRGLAQAKVALNSTDGSVKGGESSYPLHPAALDATFQLAIIAIYGGQLEHATAAYVPVQISQLYLKAGVQQHVPATAIARSSAQGLRSASSKLQLVDESGEVFLDVGSMRFTEFRETKSHELLSQQPFSSPFTRLAWKPDIRSISNDQLREIFPAPAENVDLASALEILEMICVLVAFEIYDSFVAGSKEKVSPKGDIRHWLAWIKQLVEGDDPRAQVVEVKKLSPQQRRERLAELYPKVSDRPEAAAAKLIHENAAEILNERRTGIDVLISNKLLTPLYEVGTAIAGSHPQVSNIMDLLAHANPNARILEIGAGTGSATRAAMRVLVGANGIKRFADYTFTDISAGFLTSAKEMLSHVRDVHYSVLDVEQDPMEHGYEPVYDVVLACEAIHATESMDRTLAHCRSLLKPGGKLLLAETTRMRVLLGLLYGTLTGYWQSDDRTEGPFMSLDTWQRRLTSTGFSGVDLHVDDYEAPHNTTSVLVTTRLADDDKADAKPTVKPVGEEVYLLHDGDVTPTLSKQLITEFEDRGVTVKPVQFPPEGPIQEAVPQDARVIVLLSQRNDLFDADAARLQSFQYLSRSVKSMVWLTAGSIVKGDNPRGAFMSGLLRVIATENPAGRFLSINIEGQEGFQQTGSDLAKTIVEKEVALQPDAKEGLEDDQENTDSEFVWQDGCLWVSRVVPDADLGEYAETIKTPSHQGLETLPINSHGPVRAAFETAGILHSLYFRSYTELLQPLPGDQVEIKIAAVGLNARDVAVATGRTNTAGSSLSSEYAGVVTKVGDAVKHLSPGDQVSGIGNGNLGNFERVPAAFAQKLGAGQDLIESATIPFSFTSAVYAFEHVTRLRKGHKVLIQGAAGDIGLAAIQVAQLKGAEVFAVTDTADDLSTLVDTAGIPRDQVFLLPQDQEKLRHAARNARKSGFDVILNTATKSDASHLLAPGGHFIQIGQDKLDGQNFAQNNITVSSIDLSSVLTSDPELGLELMETVRKLHQAGQITPIRPITVSSVANLDQTLTEFSKKTPRGKVVVSFQDPAAKIKVLKEPRPAAFDPEARYIITGGFGGLGRGIIRWMADRGAQRFVVLSRRAAETPSAVLLIDDMKAQGVHVEAVACDVSDKNQVAQAISKLTDVSFSRPIKGVVHAVLSLSDLTFDKLNVDQWRSGTVAKTHGTVNLHEATLEQPLDFFVLLTSTETVWAPATQAAYIAADNFAAYFARYRRRQGLPASTVSYGFVSDLGSDYRETSHGTEDMYARNLAATMSEVQALATLEPAFLREKQPVSEAEGAPKKSWIEKHHDPLSGATFFTCLSPLDLAGLSNNSSHVPRWHRDGRVSVLLRAVSDAKRHALNAAAGDELDGEGANSAAGLRRAFDEAIKEGADGRAAAVVLVTDGITNAISEMLFIDPGSVNPARSVADHGVDSLIAAELRSWFHQALRTDMRNLLDSHTSIGQLSQDIVDKALAGGE